jgi:cystinosin
MNFDFLAMNLTGFSFYSLYCSYGYFSGNDAQTGKVDLNDVIFSYHALVITILTVIQAFIFPQGKNKILPITVLGLSLLWVFCIVYSCITMVIFLILRNSKFLSQVQD